MNIFVLDLDLPTCARYHCDRHVGKMVLESAQMLSTVLRLNGVDCGYRPVHQKHPCTVWTGVSLANWKWLRTLARELNLEYRFRFDKSENHKSWDLIESLPEPSIPDIGPTPFAQAMPDQYKHPDAVTAYRNFYLGEKRKLFSWTRREPPGWIPLQVCAGSIPLKTG